MLTHEYIQSLSKSITSHGSYILSVLIYLPKVYNTVKNVVASYKDMAMQCCFFLWEVLKNFNSPLPSKSNFVVVILITVTAHVHTCILTNLTHLRDVYELGWLEVSFNTTAACIVSYPDRLKGGLGWILLHALTAYVSISAHFFAPNPKLRGHVIVAWMLILIIGNFYAHNLQQ